jgi:hypothetical protein
MDFNSLTDFEESSELFLDVLTVPKPRKLWRINNYAAGRYYFGLTESGEPEFYISVTNMISATLPTSAFLTKWIADKGYEEAERYKHERASYGTFMHALFQTYLITRRLDLDSIKPQLLAYCAAEYLPATLAVEWEYELKKDALAFAQWVKDYQVEPLFIEVVLASRDGYAGAVDLGCYLTVQENGYHATEVYQSGPRKGMPKECKVEKRVKAIVDFKSGRKGFYEANEIQLGAYEQLVTENFPMLGGDWQLYNFSPKDWTGNKPSYNFKLQSTSRSLAKLPYLVQLARIEAGKRERMVTQIGGVISQDAELSDNVAFVSMEQLAKAKLDSFKQKQAEAEAAEVQAIAEAVEVVTKNKSKRKNRNENAQPTAAEVKPKVTPRKRKAKS